MKPSYILQICNSVDATVHFLASTGNTEGNTLVVLIFFSSLFESKEATMTFGEFDIRITLLDFSMVLDVAISRLDKIVIFGSCVISALLFIILLFKSSAEGLY